MRLLMISLDSAFSADAKTLLAMPHLGGLADRGVFCDKVQTIYPSITYPAHTSILTGCYPDKHEIGHNEKFFSDLPPQKRPWNWNAEDIKADTLFQAAARAGREVASILWPVSGHNKAIRYNMPEVHALPGENQTAKILRYGSFWWLMRTEIKHGKQRVSTRQPHLDRFAVLVAQKLIEKQYNPSKKVSVDPSPRIKHRHMPDILALHLVDLDAARHREGTFSKESKAALVRLDQHVGLLLKSLEEAGVLNDTIVAVMSDHGQADVDKQFALDAYLKSSGVPARAQTLGFGAYIHVDRRDYHKVFEFIQQNQQGLHVKQIYTRKELRDMHAVPGIMLAVEAEDGVEYVDDLDGIQHRANHGFGPNHPASKCLLWLTGPPFLKGARLHQADLIDIAPTLAHALRLELPQAQGRVLFESLIESMRE